MISEAEANVIAQELVGKEVIPQLFTLEGSAIELAKNRFAQDDDGYYLVDLNMRVPAKAIAGRYPLGDEVILELDEHALSRRDLAKEIKWA
ncbi:MAG TPA: hypothetical protein VMC07_01550 [Candidatus Omnitrophota bacterium]|nr:hypothetical protein [Candidatus Omnitrophota bacterium]